MKTGRFLSARPAIKKCRSLDPFAALKRNPNKVRSPRVHRVMERPSGKNLHAGGSYAHEPSWQTSWESTVVGDGCGIGTGSAQHRAGARGLGCEPSSGTPHSP